jgi:hypothetical protein
MRNLISLALARQLKKAGLQWTPANHDFFAVPDRNMDEQVFVLTDILILIDKIHGLPAITFHGMTEWALDYVLISEVVWLPSEAQLRNQIEQHLVGQPESSLSLGTTPDGYRCQLEIQGHPLKFEAFGAVKAYGQALLYLLEHQPTG